MSENVNKNGEIRDAEGAVCEPVCELAAESEPGAVAPPVDRSASNAGPEGPQPRSVWEEGRDAVGRFAPGNVLGAATRFQPGNQDRRDHGVRGLEVRLRAGGELPAELLVEMTAFRENVIADRGGPSELSEIERGFIQRLVELETFCRLLAGNIQARGIVTRAGRVRTAYTLFLSTIDRWDRVAGRLGMARRAKRVPTLHEYLDERAAAQEPES
jgi:hypothetical protein